MKERNPRPLALCRGRGTRVTRGLSAAQRYAYYALKDRSRESATQGAMGTGSLERPVTEGIPKPS
jgi:hypothetical protein